MSQDLIVSACQALEKQFGLVPCNSGESPGRGQTNWQGGSYVCSAAPGSLEFALEFLDTLFSFVIRMQDIPVLLKVRVCHPPSIELGMDFKDFECEWLSYSTPVSDLPSILALGPPTRTKGPPEVVFEMQPNTMGFIKFHCDLWTHRCGSKL